LLSVILASTGLILWLILRPTLKLDPAATTHVLQSPSGKRRSGLPDLGSADTNVPHEHSIEKAVPNDQRVE